MRFNQFILVRFKSHLSVSVFISEYLGTKHYYKVEIFNTNCKCLLDWAQAIILEKNHFDERSSG